MKLLSAAFCFLLCADSAFAQNRKPNNNSTAKKTETAQTKPNPAASAPAPQPLYPYDRTVFEHSPRHTVLVWEKTPTAASYGIEVDCFSCCERDKWCADTGKTWMVKTDIKPTVYAFNFVGAQPARWRVWATNANGKETAKSDWRSFRFVK